jgi:hypothetical protein
MRHDTASSADVRVASDAYYPSDDRLIPSGEEAALEATVDRRRAVEITQAAPPKIDPPPTGGCLPETEGAVKIPVEPAEQLWLDVDRPIAVRARRPRAVSSPRRPEPEAGMQLELRMAPAAPRPAAPAPPELPPRAVEPPQPPHHDRASFSQWLFAQTKRSGTIGELSKAARLDRSFPRNGTVEDVRRRFARAGADGDAFMALEDAEREYDRAW